MADYSMLIEVDKEELLEIWRENGHLDDMLKHYRENEYYITDRIKKNGKFTINMKDVWVNIGYIPTSIILNKDDIDLEEEGLLTKWGDEPALETRSEDAIVLQDNEIVEIRVKY